MERKKKPSKIQVPLFINNYNNYINKIVALKKWILHKKYSVNTQKWSWNYSLGTTELGVTQEQNAIECSNDSTDNGNCNLRSMLLIIGLLYKLQKIQDTNEDNWYNR